MTRLNAVHLNDRGVLKVSGPDARAFLNGLLTSEVAGVTPSAARYAALLTPQGKILVDGFVMGATDDPDALLIDCPAPLVAELAAKLTFYKLRAKVTVEDVSARFAVLVFWDETPLPPPAGLVPDPRLPAMGWRAIVPADQVDVVLSKHHAQRVRIEDYERHRIALGVPRGGPDFVYGDAFPHEADMDQLGGVDFRKGCYVGQEVVSRMEHRGTARTRIVPFHAAGATPPAGAAVMAGEKTIGTIGSAAGERGLAMLRLDRVADAITAAEPLTAGGVAIRPAQPAWATFTVPTTKTEP